MIDRMFSTCHQSNNYDIPAHIAMSINRAEMKRVCVGKHKRRISTKVKKESPVKYEMRSH